MLSNGKGDRELFKAGCDEKESSDICKTMAQKAAEAAQVCSVSLQESKGCSLSSCRFQILREAKASNTRSPDSFLSEVRSACITIFITGKLILQLDCREGDADSPKRDYVARYDPADKHVTSYLF